MMLRPLVALAARFQSATLSLYVDDFAFSASGPHAGHTARRLPAIATAARAAFAALQLPLAADKSAVPVNTSEAGAAMKVQGEALAGDVGFVIVKLGVDVPTRHSAKGAAAKRSSRLDGARRRCRRIIATFRTVAARRKLAFASVVPAAMYGVRQRARAQHAFLPGRLHRSRSGRHQVPSIPAHL